MIYHLPQRAVTTRKASLQSTLEFSITGSKANATVVAATRSYSVMDEETSGYVLFTCTKCIVNGCKNNKVDCLFVGKNCWQSTWLEEFLTHPMGIILLQQNSNHQRQ